MAETIEIICVVCPKGCTLKVIHQGGKMLSVDGGCKRGEKYAASELQDPRRMVASTVKVKNGLYPLVPVYTEKAFPKHLIPQLVKELRKVEVPAPVKIRQIVLENAHGTGINIVASRDMPKGE